MGADYGIVYPLWNYAADGGELLDRAAGEVGLEHVTVPVVTGPQSQFRLTCDREAPYFQTEGGWHFPPQTKLYSAAGGRPPKARWFAAADHLAHLRQHADRLGLRLVLRIAPRSIPALLEHEPHLCQQNAWGQPVAAAGACVCNPALRELLQAAWEDLRQYGPSGWELANWGPDAWCGGSAAPLPWGGSHAAGRLLAICFCAACRQSAARAGIDPDQVARSVRVQIERQLSGRRQDEREEPLTTAYNEARHADCHGWLERLAERDGWHGLLRDFESARPELSPEPSSWMRILRLPPSMRVGHEPAPTVAALLRASSASGLSFTPWAPSFVESAELVRFVTNQAAAGARVFDFEGLDAAPAEAVTWLKQAVRFARRG